MNLSSQDVSALRTCSPSVQTSVEVSTCVSVWQTPLSVYPSDRDTSETVVFTQWTGLQPEQPGQQFDTLWFWIRMREQRKQSCWAAQIIKPKQRFSFFFSWVHILSASMIIHYHVKCISHLSIDWKKLLLCQYPVKKDQKQLWFSRTACLSVLSMIWYVKTIEKKIIKTSNIK